jgi:hypothetical protein
LISALDHHRGCDAVEDRGFDLQIAKRGIRDSFGLAVLGLVLINVDQPVNVGKGQRLEEDVARDAEEGGVRADAQGEDQNRAGAELPIADEAPQRVFTITLKRVEDCFKETIQRAGYYWRLLIS